MNSAPVTYSQRSDVTPECEVAVLSNVFKYVLDCHAKKEAAFGGRLDDGTKAKGDSANVSSLPH